MTKKFIPNHVKLIKQFEGKEAIFFDQGMIKVRVFNIKANPYPDRSTIQADIEEIPTEGFGIGKFRRIPAIKSSSPFSKFLKSNYWIKGKNRISFRIIVGHRSLFSKNEWVGDNFCWTIYFDPKFIDRAVEYAKKMHPCKDYSENQRALEGEMHNLEWFVLRGSESRKYEKVFPNFVKQERGHYKSSMVIPRSCPEAAKENSSEQRPQEKKFALIQI